MYVINYTHILHVIIYIMLTIAYVCYHMDLSIPQRPLSPEWHSLLRGSANFKRWSIEGGIQVIESIPMKGYADLSLFLSLFHFRAMLHLYRSHAPVMLPP
jgi:hypothetical protein